MVQTAGLLEKALGEHGLRFSDIDRILVTHGHPDHCGAAKKVVKAGRAKLPRTRKILLLLKADGCFQKKI